MANRTLTTWEEKPNAFGYHATARIERLGKQVYGLGGEPVA